MDLIHLLMICSVLPMPECCLGVVFHDDFEQPVNQWELGQWWSIQPSLGIMQEYFTKTETFIACERDTAFSPVIDIPMDIDSLYVNIPYTYYVSLGLSGNNFWMYFKLELLAYDENGLIFDTLLEGDSESGLPTSFNGDGECLVALPEGVWEPGDAIRIALAGMAYCEHAYSTELARVTLDWEIESVTLWSEYPTGLVRDTWASLKASF